MGAVLGEESGDERVGHGFERSVGESKNESSQVKEKIGGILVLTFGGSEGDKSREHVEEERGDHELAVSHLVHDDTADNNSEAEAGEAGAADIPELSAGEAEVSTPVGEDAPADTEADACRQDSQKSRPEQAHAICFGHDDVEFGLRVWVYRKRGGLCTVGF